LDRDSPIFDLLTDSNFDHGVPGPAFKIKAKKEEEKVINSGKRLHNYLLSRVKSRNRI
jgi:hypothetical protein